MKPLVPKYQNLLKIELKVTDRSYSILKHYAEYSKRTEDEVIEHLIDSIIEDDKAFVKYLLSKRNGKRAVAIILQNKSNQV